MSFPSTRKQKKCGEKENHENKSMREQGDVESGKHTEKTMRKRREIVELAEMSSQENLGDYHLGNRV